MVLGRRRDPSDACVHLRFHVYTEAERSAKVLRPHQMFGGFSTAECAKCWRERTKKSGLLPLRVLRILITEGVAELHVHRLLAGRLVPANTHARLLVHVCVESEHFNVNATRDRSVILG